MYQTPTNCRNEFQQLHFQNYMQENALVASPQVDTQTKKTIVVSYAFMFLGQLRGSLFFTCAPRSAQL